MKKIKPKRFWRPGQMTRLARLAAVAPTNLSSTLHRRRPVSLKRAYALEIASRLVLEHPIHWADWLHAKTSTHPAFFGKPLGSPYAKQGKPESKRLGHRGK